MLLAPDLRDAPFVVLLPPGRSLEGELPPELRDAVVVEVGQDGCRMRETGEELDSLSWTGSAGWHVKLGEAPDAFEQTIMDRTDWGAPEIRVIPNGEMRPTLRCRLPMNEEEELVVGRSSRRAHLAIEDEHVSRRHLRFYLQDGKPMVQDLDSRGGTFLNGERIQAPTELHHQDSLRIGNTTLEYFAFLEALDGLPDFEELSQPVQGDERSSRPGPDGSSTPEDAEDQDSSPNDASPQELEADPAEKRQETTNLAGNGRPVLDTVMYSMAILTIVVALFVAWKFLS